MNSVNVVRPNRKKPDVAYITGSTFFDVPLLRRRRVSALYSSAVLADLENVGDDFEILLLSIIEALRYLINTSDNDSHL